MKIILVTSQKGGSGKTTLAAHLSVESQLSTKKPVLLIDVDKQASLTRWHERRPEETPVLGNASFSNLQAALLSVKKTYSFCFIDSAPTISADTVSLIKLSDLVLVPVRPSPQDLWSVSDTVELIKQQKKRLLFVVTQAKRTAAITAQAATALAKYGRVAETYIGDRVIYASSMTSGNVASEISPSSTAASEIKALWEEIASLL